MPLYLLVLLFLAALALVIKGGDLFVDASGWIAKASGIPTFLVGATLVSVATTLPEMMVSLIATEHAMADLAVGNAVGSVTANTGLILPIALLAAPLAAPRGQYGAKLMLLLAAGAVLMLGCLGGSLAGWGSLILLALLALFLVENVRGARDAAVVAERPLRPDGATITYQAVKFIAGAAWVTVGAHIMVFSAGSLARALGVSERVIAVAMVAIGTSLPELVTTVTAVVKRQGALSVGNIVGANLIDLALILPLCSASGALAVSPQSLSIDLPVCLGVLLLAFLPALWRQRFSRWQGVALLAGYGLYLTLGL